MYIYPSNMDGLPFDPSTLTRDDLEAIGVGLSSIVVYIKGTNVVAKTFPPLDKDQHSERRIYEHLQKQGQGHPNILKYFGRSPPEHELLRGGLLLEYHPRGTLSACFGKLDTIGVPETEKRRFVTEFFLFFLKCMPRNGSDMRLLAGPTRPYRQSPTSIPGALCTEISGFIISSSMTTAG
jgi:hypothetical protein